MSDHCEGTAEAKRRLRVILETLGGTKSVKEACAELGLGEARFHELRTVVLAGAVKNLELGAAGRPRREEPAGERRLRELEAEIRALKFQLHAANVREELAIAMPHLLRPRKKGDQKKTAVPIITNRPSPLPSGMGL